MGNPLQAAAAPEYPPLHGGKLLLLTVAMTLALRGKINEHHSEKLEVLSLYWHFVDAVWVIVFTVVYVLGR